MPRASSSRPPLLVFYRPSSDEGIDHESILSLMISAGLLLAALVPEPLLSLYRCPLKHMTGLPCPSCGMTRATVALAHGHIVDALVLNPVGALALLLGLMLTVYVGVCRLARWPRVRPNFDHPLVKSGLRVGFFGLLLGNWAYLMAVGR